MHTRSYLRRATGALGAVALAVAAVTAGAAPAFAATTTTVAPTTTAAPTTTSAPTTTGAPTTTSAPTTTVAPGSTTSTTGASATTTTGAPGGAKRLLAAAPVADPSAALALSSGQATAVGPHTVSFSSAGSVATGGADTFTFDPGDAADALAIQQGSAAGLPAAFSALTYTTPGTYKATLTLTNPATAPATVSAASVTITVGAVASDATCAAATQTTTACAMDLYAKAGGTVHVADDYQVWGFTTTSAAAPALPGPVLVATAGQTLTLTLHNQLTSTLHAAANNTAACAATCDPGTVSLEIPGLAGAPDITGIADGTTHDYTFTLDRPGTFLVEAGATPGGARQVAMGMTATLIVRPPTPGNWATNPVAYGNGGAFDAFTPGREQVVAVQEIDPAYNKDPFANDLVDYHPSVFLLNGHTFDPANPTAGAIHAAPGDTMLVRYLDMGLRDHSMRLLNARQTVAAHDSYLLPTPTEEAGVWLNAGQVSDAFITVPPVLPPAGSAPLSYALYDGGLHLHNDLAGGLGGIFTTIIADQLPVGAAPTQLGPQGPAVTCGNPPAAGCTQPVTVTSLDGNAPAISNSGSDLAATANFVAQTTGTTVTAGRWFLDTLDPTLPGGVTNGGPITAPDASCPAGVSSGAFGAATATIGFCIPWSVLLPMLAATPGGAFGDHVIWVQGQDSASTWGQAAGDVVSLPVKDALVSALTLSPDVTNSTATGSVISGTPNGQVAITGTATASLARYVISDNPNPAPNGTPGAEACVVGPIPAGELVPTVAEAGSCAVDGSNLPLAVSPSFPASAPIAAISGSIALPGATDGQYWVFVHAYEALPTYDNTGAVNGLANGRWSPFLYADPAHPTLGLPGTYKVLTVVGSGGNGPGGTNPAGPAVSGLTLDPNPNDGTQSNSANLGLFNSVLLTGTATSTVPVSLAEAFVAEPGQTQAPVICTTPNVPIGCATAWGTGLEAVPANGVWGSSTTQGFSAYLPLPAFQGRPAGPVPIFVHAQDSAGNWGPFTEVDLTLVDHTLPTVNSFVIAQANPGQATVQAQDPPSAGAIASGITGAEWFVGADPGVGLGHAVAPFASTAGTAVATFNFTPGVGHGGIAHVRVKDGAGNWSAVATATRP